MAELGNEWFAIVRDDFDKCSTPAQDILEYPVADSLRGLLLKHPVLWVMGKQTATLDNVRKSARAGKVHCVHVHFCEKQGWSRDDRGNGDLSGLTKLAYVACLDEPSNVAADVGPPVPLCEEGMGCEISVVPDVVVRGLHCFGSLSFEEYPLVGALWIALPKYADHDEESHGIAGCD